MDTTKSLKYHLLCTVHELILTSDEKEIITQNLKRRKETFTNNQSAQTFYIA